MCIGERRKAAAKESSCPQWTRIRRASGLGSWLPRFSLCRRPVLVPRADPEQLKFPPPPHPGAPPTPDGGRGEEGRSSAVLAGGGGCWGTWARTFHPRNVETAEFVNIFVDVSPCRRSIFRREDDSWRCPVVLAWFANFLMLYEVIAELASNHKSAFCFRTTGIWWIQEIVKLWTSGSLRNLSSAVSSEARFGDPDDWWLSRMKVRRSKEDQVKDVASKVRIWGVNRWQTCKYVKLAPKSRDVKDVCVHVHIRNIL
jgi:hypothetical protein